MLLAVKAVFGKSMTTSVNGDEQFRETATAANKHHVTVCKAQVFCVTQQLKNEEVLNSAENTTMTC